MTVVIYVFVKLFLNALAHPCFEMWGDQVRGGRPLGGGVWRANFPLRMDLQPSLHFFIFVDGYDAFWYIFTQCL